MPPPPAPDENKVLVYASDSHSISELNSFLAGKNLFVPHGQCGYVHLGGHVQTGGYGQLARSFGLLGDHIWGVRMICYDGTIQEISRGFKVELLNAILGGSPCNFGVITHYIIEVLIAMRTTTSPRPVQYLMVSKLSGPTTRRYLRRFLVK